MKTVEKLSLILVIVVGLCLAVAGYYLFLDEGPSQPSPKKKAVVQEEPLEMEVEVVSKIEGDTGVLEDEALPRDEEKDIGALAGRILDPDKEPLPEAKVAVFRAKSPGAFILNRKIKPLYTTETDEKGAFVFTPLYPGDGYRVMVDHDLYMRKLVPDIRVEQADRTELDDIQLMRGKTAYGKVKAEGGGPIGGAVVAIYDPLENSLDTKNYAAERVVKTDEKGVFTIEYLDDTNFIIKAWAEGYASQTIRNEDIFTKKEKFEFNFYLTKALNIAGGVFDQNDEPIAGAVIHAISMKQKMRQNFTATTNDKGKFKLEGLPNTQFHISATHQLYSTSAATKIDAGREDVFFQLERRSGLAGQVLDTSDKPVRTFWVQVKRLNRSTDAWCTTEVRRRFQHKEGRFIMDGLDPGKYEIEVVASGFAPFKSEPVKVVRTGPTGNLVFKLNQGGRISGSVLSPEGRPLKRALISLRRNNYRPNPVENFFGVVAETRLKSTRSDENGHFMLEKIVPGTYQVEYAHGSYPPQRTNNVLVELDQNTQLEPMWLKQGATLQGRVYNDANAPLQGVKVTIRHKDNTFTQSATTDKNGNYKISDIPPGIYSVSPIPKPDPTVNPLTQLPSVIKSEVKDVEIREGEVKELSLIVYS
jgi:protocatechuate 3,4-dioxygenase beta subunit